MGRGVVLLSSDMSLGEIRIVLDSWVNLPRLGSEAFKELMKAGVEYTTGKGFFIRSSIDLRLAKRVISAAVGGEVYFVFKCFICGNEASCADCSYRAGCSVELVGGKCVCLGCSKENFVAYRRKWLGSLDGS
jgi:hypothetical protein